ncbi:GGDEF domain-containing protein [Marinobacter fuscus]|uniref:GGDEF domain-containing protein n=1 Tax=Marinobacter fuscus TaxID=2109942 RepID=A0A2T1K6V1_9GAMM|nr:EAL domain-containing protein [Marinobacter fuscus]PSF05252.1 GGDEF domain-containing protein [Marinobacter fuscus]
MGLPLAQALTDGSFKALVDRHPRAVMLATRDARIVYVNEMFHTVTGYSHDEVIGQSPSMLSSGLHTPDFYQKMWRSLTRAGRWEGLIWNRRKNGDKYPQWLTIYSVNAGGSEFYAGVFMDVGDRASIDERVASLAYYDPLTELPNRSLFREFLKARTGQRPRGSNTFAVLFIDLDFFKAINELHGHDHGDKVLRQVAACIRDVLRQSDVLARLSGDEFAAIVELERPQDLDVVCDRLMAMFRAPLLVGHREYFLSASVGAAMFHRDGETASELLQNADRAMHTAKADGRACYRVYSADEDSSGRQEHRLSEALVTSLKVAPGEFSVVYQPQYDLATGKVLGLEALLRWHHPELGMVSPARFVPVAEQRGYIHELTERLIACIDADLQQTALKDGKGRRLAINISARQITDNRLESLLEPFFERLRRAHWQPEIEITETHMMNLSRGCLAKLAEYGEKNVIVAIDDFGTGYSSLAYLHRLPVHVLKIDRQFVQRIGQIGDDAGIVSAILAIAEALNLEVVAEGIETEAQKSQLQTLRCHRGQGYLLARPAPIGQLSFD